MTEMPEKVNLSDVSSRKVDVELLQELRDLFARGEDQKERYDFTWNGKAKAYFEAATPTTKTLRPQPEESYIYADDEYQEKVNTFNDSENLFITGDNLEALKLLQESYLGKIDMIYIDPPYNTGKDFVYHDNFKQTQKEADIAEGNVDEEGNRLVKNEKNSGRYHSDWLSMMYPRLKLARNLLSDTGVIFVSIDDNEQANLKLLMDEVFGEANFVGEIVWEGNGKNDSKYISESHEYVTAYVKNIGLLQENNVTWRAPKQGIDRIEKKANEFVLDSNDYIEASKKLKRWYSSLNKNDDAWKHRHYNNIDKKGVYFAGDISAESGRNRKPYEVLHPITNRPVKWPTRGLPTKSTMLDWINKGLVDFGNDENQVPKRKRYLSETQEYVMSSVIYKDSRAAYQYLTNLLGPKIFDTPKDVDIVKLLIQISTHTSSLILDFFSGSATTADAVMQLNKEKGENHRYIMVQLPEQTKLDSVAYESGYASIDQISRERIRRAAKKIGDTSGFRALKVDKTGLKEDVFKIASEFTQEDVLLDVDNQANARSDFDLLYEVLVDGALEYNRQIATEMINNEPIIKYDYLGELSGVIAYFGDNLTNELTREIAKLKPLIVVFKESTFNKSSDKVNVLEQFRVISPETKVKVV